MVSHGLAVGFLLLGLMVSTASQAEESAWDIAANVDVQGRFFADSAGWVGQDDQNIQPSLALTAEFRWRSEDSRASIIPFARWDQVDSQRSLVDLREAYWAFEGDDVEVLIGANTVFWGVAESVHLVDVINQTDAASDIDGEDKLGQPMINLELQRDWGLLSVFVMPYFRERNFAGVDGRLRTPLPVDEDAALFESNAKHRHVDLALRYSHYFGDIDVGISAFRGTSREPRLVVADDLSALVPIYDQMDQVGVDLQYTRDAWLWKLEAIHRRTDIDDFVAAVGGFEYTVYQVFESSADIGWLVEYQHDDRSTQSPLVLSDNDVFMGSRLALNDVQDTAVLAGIVHDLETAETFVNVEAERRFGDQYFVELRARFFGNAEPGDATYAVQSDDYVEIQLSRYF